ncbi:unnamed protein product, partial [Sphacelaria rigidula]
MVGYSHSAWSQDTENRRGITGYLLLSNGLPIAWKSKSQMSHPT